MVSIVRQSFLKQTAKKLKKDNNLNWHQALDEAARQFGFTNYKNYQNILDAIKKDTSHINEKFLRSLSAEKSISKKLALAIQFIENNSINFKEFFDILLIFQRADGLRYFLVNNESEYLDYWEGLNPIQELCVKFDFMKSEVQKVLLDDFLTEEGSFEIDTRAPYFVAKAITVSEPIYELEKNILFVDGTYHLTTEIGLSFENEEDKNNERFNDRSFEGTFEISITSDKQIKIEHSDMSIWADEDNHDGFAMASFR